MVTLNGPDGSKPEDFNLSRRGLVGVAALAGYAVSAVCASAEPIKTDEAGLTTAAVALKAADRDVPAYLARPAKAGRHPVVIVVSEIFGVHEYIRDVCRRLAKAGYVAIAPDFFVRQGDPSTLTDFAAVREIVAKTTEAQTLGDLAATLSYLKAQSFVDAKRIGITGFCWGGAVVWIAASRFAEIKAGVAWYGRLSRPTAGGFLADPDRHWPIEEAKALKAPVLGLYAEKDQGIPLADVEAMRAALKAAGETKSQIVVYPGAQHGFHADYRASYDAKAAADGWAKMLAFFKAQGV